MDVFLPGSLGDQDCPWGVLCWLMSSQKGRPCVHAARPAHGTSPTLPNSSRMAEVSLFTPCLQGGGWLGFEEGGSRGARPPRAGSEDTLKQPRPAAAQDCESRGLPPFAGGCSPSPLHTDRLCPLGRPLACSSGAWSQCPSKSRAVPGQQSAPACQVLQAPASTGSQRGLKPGACLLRAPPGRPKGG